VEMHEEWKCMKSGNARRVEVHENCIGLKSHQYTQCSTFH